MAQAVEGRDMKTATGLPHKCSLIGVRAEGAALGKASQRRVGELSLRTDEEPVVQ